jgi:predicted acylesterase/phospholipase RssA
MDGDDNNPLERNPADEANQCYIWEAARATSAAPSYFTPITINNIIFGDGGFGFNNPTRLLYWEVIQMNDNDQEANGLIVSIGTGQFNYTRFKKGPFTRALAWFDTAKLVASDCEATHEQCRDGFGKKYPYFRFNLPSGAIDKIKLDEWKTSPWHHRSKPSTEEVIRTQTQAYLDTADVKNKIKEVATLLVEKRRARSKTSEWEKFAVGIRYVCRQKACREKETFHTKEKLRQHIEFHYKDRPVTREIIEAAVERGVINPNGRQG